VPASFASSLESRTKSKSCLRPVHGFHARNWDCRIDGFALHSLGDATFDGKSPLGRLIAILILLVELVGIEPTTS
jgi:hypothetical protein